jgi:GH25 family lysozyme M1 (1,4-beta-N-acetylmuramidase)
MPLKSGIDVSWANGTINWKAVKPHVDFCMIRAGFGSKTVDSKFKENAEGCRANNIPFGVYWFSYALNESMARAEAKKCLSVVRPYKLAYPIAFDFEYDSLEYAKKQKVTISPSKMCSIACAFLDEILANGYDVLLYTNPDFWFNRGFKQLGNRYSIWCAHWNVEKPAVFCDMWQDSSNARVEGITGPVDTNVSYKGENSTTKVEQVNAEYCAKYLKTAREVIGGVYGNGDARVKKLLAQEKDPNFVQALVNALLNR